MRDVVLPDTSLCAIVRDEKINPAGGIKRFLRSIMPHVEEGVVLDTGSLDGTREILEESKKEFPNLRIYDSDFKGYAEARNDSLSYVRTENVLVLDADEIILQQDYLKLAKLVKNNEDNYKLSITEIDWIKKKNYFGHHIRLFKRIGKRFHNSIGWSSEHLENKEHFIPISAELLHFLPPTSDALALKLRNWYGIKLDERKLPPCKIVGFEKWKEFNPHRNEYRASNLDS